MADGLVHSLILSLPKDERSLRTGLSRDARSCSWFDKLTTSGNVRSFRTRHSSGAALLVEREV